MSQTSYIKTTKEEHEAIYKMDALTFLLSYYPERVVQENRKSDPSKAQYHLVEHDSLKFNKGKWFWFSEYVGGYTAYQFLTVVDKLSGEEAHNLIYKKMKGKDPLEITYDKEDEKVEMIAPIPYCYGRKEWKITDDGVEQYIYRKNIYQYLCHERCIDKEIVDYFIDHKMVYEEKGYYHNVCFIGYKYGENEKNVPGYCFKRGMKSQFKREHLGSDKGFMFRYIGKQGNTVHLFEAAIDMLSYMTLAKEKGYAWQDDSYIALGGVTRMKSKEQNTSIPLPMRFAYGLTKSTRMKIHFDNDEAGISATNAYVSYHGAAITENATLEIFDHHVTHEMCKDVNDYLKLYLKSKKVKTR